MSQIDRFKKILSKWDMPIKGIFIGMLRIRSENGSWMVQDAFIVMCSIPWFGQLKPLFKNDYIEISESYLPLKEEISPTELFKQIFEENGFLSLGNGIKIDLGWIYSKEAGWFNREILNNTVSLRYLAISPQNSAFNKKPYIDEVDLNFSLLTEDIPRRNFADIAIEYFWMRKEALSQSYNPLVKLLIQTPVIFSTQPSYLNNNLHISLLSNSGLPSPELLKNTKVVVDCFDSNGKRHTRKVDMNLAKITELPYRNIAINLQVNLDDILDSATSIVGAVILSFRGEYISTYEFNTQTTSLTHLAELAGYSFQNFGDLDNKNFEDEVGLLLSRLGIQYFRPVNIKDNADFLVYLPNNGRIFCIEATTKIDTNKISDTLQRIKRYESKVELLSYKYKLSFVFITSMQRSKITCLAEIAKHDFSLICLEELQLLKVRAEQILNTQEIERVFDSNMVSQTNKK